MSMIGDTFGHFDKYIKERDAKNAVDVEEDDFNLDWELADMESDFHYNGEEVEE